MTLEKQSDLEKRTQRLIELGKERSRTLVLITYGDGHGERFYAAGFTHINSIDDSDVISLYNNVNEIPQRLSDHFLEIFVPTRHFIDYKILGINTLEKC